MTTPDDTTEKPTLISPLGVAIAFFAALGLFAVVYGTVYSLGHRVGRWQKDVQLLWPYAVLLDAALAGYRRLAGILAVLIAIGGGLLFALYAVDAGFHEGPAFKNFGNIVVLHLCLLIVGIVEAVRSAPAVRRTARRALIATTSTVALWVSAGAWMYNRYAAAARHQADEQIMARLTWTTESNLRILTRAARCLEQARGVDGSGRYPRTATTFTKALVSRSGDCGFELTHVDSSGGALTADVSSHARLRYVPPSTSVADTRHAVGYTFAVNAMWTSNDYVITNAPGSRSYLIDTAGAIHVTAEHRPATVDDPLVPHCGSLDRTIECHDFVPRQRWGVTEHIPTGAFAPIQDSVRVGDTASVAIRFEPVDSLDAVRAIEISWGEHNESTHVVVPAAQGYAKSHQPLTFPLPHVFTEKGLHVVRAVLTTRDGWKHDFIDSVAVHDSVPRVSAIGIDASGRLVPGDVHAQARQALANIGAALQERHWRTGRITYCTVFLRHLDDWGAVGTEYMLFFRPYPPFHGFVERKDLKQGALVQFNCRGN